MNGIRQSDLYSDVHYKCMDTIYDTVQSAFQIPVDYMTGTYKYLEYQVVYSVSRRSCSSRVALFKTVPVPYYTVLVQCTVIPAVRIFVERLFDLMRWTME